MTCWALKGLLCISSLQHQTAAHGAFNLPAWTLLLVKGPLDRWRDILLLGHPTAGTSYCRDILLQGHPITGASNCWDILLLGHPTAATSYCGDTLL